MINLSDDARTLMLAVGDAVRMRTAAHELEEAGLIERHEPAVLS